MLHLEKKHLDILKSILSKYPYSFSAFGSRTKGNFKKFSDIDLCYFEDIPLNILSHIKEDFEESSLPFNVDFVNWNSCDEEFKKIIEKDFVMITKSKSQPTGPRGQATS